MRENVCPFRLHVFNMKFISRNFGDRTSYVLKEWIDLNYKIIKSNAKLHFLIQCRNNKVFPSHLMHMSKSKLHVWHYRSLRKIERLVHTIRTESLKIEVFDLFRCVDALHKRLLFSSRFLYDCLPFNIWHQITSHHYRSFNNFKYKLTCLHKKKLDWLLESKRIELYKKIKPIEFSCEYTNDGRVKTNNIKFGHSNSDSDINISIEPFEFISSANNNPLDIVNEKWFLNLSNVHIPTDVSYLLQLGEKFSLPFAINRKRAVHEFIKDLESIGSKHTIDNQIRIRNAAISQFSKISHKRPLITTIERKLIARYNSAIQFQRNNPDVMFTRADKGNVTVALDRNDYLGKIETLLSDRNTYEVVRKNPSAKIERELNNFTKKWLHKEYISKNQYYFLHSSDSLLPKAYGLPKIHKKDIPFRIIVSSVNTALYNLASFLHKILVDSLQKPKSHVNNSFELCTDLSKIRLLESEILISLDVVSLFTNVPSELVVEGIRKRWKFIKTKTKLSQSEFISAIKFVLASTFFSFNNVIYKQTFGSPMGSPLSPILADIVMEDLEEKVLGSLNICISLYKRYVDDIVMTIPKDSVQDVLSYFNNYHDRLKFTVEFEENGRLSFLDLLLIKKNNLIITDWFHKKTFSGRLLSYFSSHPIQHKIGTIYSLLDRAILLSHPSFYNKNISFVINVLLDNGYPIDLIFSHINKRLRKLQSSKRDNNANDSGCPERRNNFIVMPYLKSISEVIASAVNKSENSVGYRIINKLNNIIKVQKDRNSHFTNNDVIYKICCNNCDASYVGQTKRQLHTRLKEHKNNIKLDDSKHSVVSEHILKFNHSFDWENTSILEIERNYKKRLIAEMIHIKEQKNGINLNKDTELLDDAYSDVLNLL